MRTLRTFVLALAALACSISSADENPQSLTSSDALIDSLVVLGAAGEPRACLGLKLRDSRSVATTAHCAIKSSHPLDAATFGICIASAAQNSSTRAVEERINVTLVNRHPERTAAAALAHGEEAFDVAMLTLRGDPAAAVFQGFELSNQLSIEQVRHSVDAHERRVQILRVSKSSLAVTWKSGVTLANADDCGLDSHDSIVTAQIACVAVPANAGRPIHPDVGSSEDTWSLLVATRAESLEVDVLGFKSSRSDAEGFQTFTWLSALLSSSNAFRVAVPSPRPATSLPTSLTPSPSSIAPSPSLAIPSPSLAMPSPAPTPSAVKPHDSSSGSNSGDDVSVPVPAPASSSSQASDAGHKYSDLLKSFVVLGSSSNPRMCLGILVTADAVLLPAHCVYSHGHAPQFVRFGFAVSSSDVAQQRRAAFNETQQLTVQSVRRAASVELEVDIPGLMADASRLLQIDYALAVLDGRQSPSVSTVRLLDETLEAVQDDLEAAQGELVAFHVDIETLELSWTEAATIVDSDACSGLVQADGVYNEAFFACTRSDDRGTDTARNAWSALAYAHRTDGASATQRTTSFLGFGSAHATAPGPIEAFSWASTSAWVTTAARMQWTYLADTRVVPELAADLQFIADVRYSRRAQSFCSAAMIVGAFAMTAAHCVADIDLATQQLWVSGGTLMRIGSKYGEQMKVLDVIVHPAYDAVSRANNVALLQVGGNTLRSRAMLFNSQPVPTEAQLFLLGRPSVDGPMSYHARRIVDVSLAVLNDTCSVAIGAPAAASTSFCAANRDGEDACSRDVGGAPLVVRDASGRAALLGIAGHSRGCRDAGVPGVFTNVSSIKRFLDKAVEGIQPTWSEPQHSSSGSSSSGGGHNVPGELTHDHTSTADALAVLGSRTQPHACLAVLVGDTTAVAPAHCTASIEADGAWLDFGFSVRKSASTGGYLGSISERVPIARIVQHPQFANSSSNSSATAAGYDWALILLQRAPLRAHARLLPVLDEYASTVRAKSQRRAVVDRLRVNRATLELTWDEGVQLDDNAACGLPVSANQTSLLVCASRPRSSSNSSPISRPISRRQLRDTSDEDWSLLVYYETHRAGESVKHLLGFVSSHDARDNNIVGGAAFESFTWAEGVGPEFIGKPLADDVVWSHLDDEVVRTDVPSITRELTFITGIRQERKSSNFCGGSLISATFVLTAAHCVTDARGAPWVSIGSLLQNGSTMGEQIRVARVIVHPLFDPVEKANDLALLELAYASVATPVPLFNALQMPTAGQIFGYGALNNRGQAQADVLHVVDLAIVASNRVCMQDLQRSIDASMFCAVSPTGKQEDDACLGDSGGPLAARDVNGRLGLLGLVSYGLGCGLANVPGVYASVAKGEAFISDYVLGAKWMAAKKVSEPTTPPTPTSVSSSAPTPVSPSAPLPPRPTPSPRAGDTASSGRSPTPTTGLTATPGSTPTVATPPGLPSAAPQDIRAVASASTVTSAPSRSSNTVAPQVFTIEPDSLSPGVRSGLVAFLIGTTDSIDSSRARALFQDTQLVLRSTQSLAPLETLLERFDAKPLHQRVTRFVATTLVVGNTTSTYQC